MVLLLNILFPLVLLIIFYISYRFRNVKLLIVIPVFILIYAFVQPSYMPKGTVKALPNAEFRASAKEINDRMLKPVSSEERDAKREAEYKSSDERREAFVDKLKKEKE